MLILLSIVTWPILLCGQKHALGTNMKMDRCWVTRLFLHHVPNILRPQNELPWTQTAQEKEKRHDDNGRGC